MRREYQYDYHVKTWKLRNTPLSWFEVEWFHRDKGWITSWGYIHNKTERDIEECLARDIAYFYDDIDIRVVKITKTIVSEHKGSQPR